MNKISNAILLAIWIVGVILGVIAAVFSIELSPVSFICAALICCKHYGEKLVRDE